MKQENPVLISLKYLFGLLVKHLIFWPLWWYSGGFLLVLKASLLKIAKTWRGLALDVWLKNIFKPMYNQYDATSRIISFLIRLVQIIFRLIMLMILAVFILIWPIIYLLLPALALWQLVRFYFFI